MPRRIGRGPRAARPVAGYERFIDAQPALPQALSTGRFISVANSVHWTGLARAGCADKAARDDGGDRRWRRVRPAYLLLSLSLDRGGSVAGLYQRPLALVAPRREVESLWHDRKHCRNCRSGIRPVSLPGFTPAADA